MQVIKGKKLEEEEDPYYSPANVESEIYAQLHQQGIRMIRDKDIELVDYKKLLLAYILTC